MDMHLAEFTKHLIEREGGRVSVAMLVSVFTNLGNPIEGRTPEDQRQTVTEMFSGNNPDFNLKDGIITMRQNNEPEEVNAPDTKVSGKSSK